MKINGELRLIKVVEGELPPGVEEVGGKTLAYINNLKEELKLAKDMLAVR